MSKFSDLLKTKIGDVERPKNRPIGTYIGQVMRVTMFDNSEDFDPSDDKSYLGTVDFYVRPVEALDDVDEDDLAEYGELSEGRPIKVRKFLRSEQDLWGFRKFLENVFDVDSSEDFETGLAGIRGQMVKGAVTHRVYEDELFDDMSIRTFSNPDDDEDV